MGKILGRYFFVEIGSAFLAGLAIFSFTLVLVRVLGLMQMIFARGVPAAQVLRLFAYIIPTFLEVAMPMALLLAVVVAFGRLGRDGELGSLASAGLNIYQMAVPVMLFATLIAGLTFGLSVWARPWGKRHVETTLYELAKTRATAALRPHVFNADYDDLVIYVDSIDPAGGLLKGIMLADERRAGAHITVFADSGRIVGNQDTGSIYLHLLDGTSMSSFEDAQSWDWTNFDSLEVNLVLDDASTEGGRYTNDPRKMSWTQLLASRSTSNSGQAIAVSLEINRKFAISTATLLLAIFGIPLGMRPTHSVRSRGVGISIAIILGYYLLLNTGDGLAREGLVDPFVAMWIPNALLAALGVWTFRATAGNRQLRPAIFGALITRSTSKNPPDSL